MSATADWCGFEPRALDRDLREAISASCVANGEASSAFVLRPDQDDVVSSFRRFAVKVANGGSPFGRIVLPPRTGKTVVAGHILSRTRLHTTFIVPTRALVGQTIEQLKAVAPSTEVGSFCGETKAPVRHGVNVTTYAMLQHAWTQDRLPWSIRTSALIFADEGHHAMTARRQALLQRAFLPSALRVALTATPDYDVSRTLCRFFPGLIRELTLEEAIGLGLLAPLRYWVAEVDADASSVRMIAGDFDERHLGEIMSAAPVFRAAEVFRYAAANIGRKALIACASRQQARDLAAYLAPRCPVGSPAPAVVLGETPREERESILAAYARGDIDTLIQVGVLIEGWNAPSCKLLIDLAPSRSRVRATQKYFRVMTRLGGAEARIYILMPAGLPELPILPSELFGRSYDDYVCGSLVGRASDPGDDLPVEARDMSGVAGVRLSQRIVLGAALEAPKLDPKKWSCVRQVVESSLAFDPERPCAADRFARLSFKHPLFSGSGALLLRWTGHAPTWRSYSAFLERLWPERGAEHFLLITDVRNLSCDNDARHLERSITASASANGHPEEPYASAWRALGGTEAPLDAEQMLIERDRYRLLHELVQTLPPRKRRFVSSFYGLGGAPRQTYAELAETDGIGQSRAHQIVRHALWPLRFQAKRMAVRHEASLREMWGVRFDWIMCKPDCGE